MEQRVWSIGYGAEGMEQRVWSRGKIGDAEVDEKSKLQITNNKQITMTEIRNFKSVLVIEYWNLRFNCNLVLGIWDFELF